LRILFALPGFHRYDRGAETALIALASELSEFGEDVTLIGSGESRPGTPYRFIRAHSIRRERFEPLPALPVLRDETKYEEATFALPLWRTYLPQDFDVTISCSFPFINWVLRTKRFRGHRPAHVFVTQNGDWPAFATNAEYRTFGCDGLVCTNPDYFARNQDRWRSILIPNGVDAVRFSPGEGTRARFALPGNAKVVLMVSALIASKRVAAGVRAVARIPEAHLIVAGDGPLRGEVGQLADEIMPGRFSCVTLPASEMADLYRSADVFLHLSKMESFGNVFIEAMASGLPIVAHDDARVRWIVGDHEHLADTEDAGALDVALRLALTEEPHYRDARLIRASRFAWRKIAGDYRSFLERIILQAHVDRPFR
jgi:glycosyltransferase involved in cell wall biosynthesis